MANPISGAYQAQQTEPINQTTKTNTTSKPVDQTTAPHDTVTISATGKAASQAQQAAQRPAQTKTAGADAHHRRK